MNSFDMLSEKIRSKIVDKGWKQLTEVQELTIPYILETKKDLIISSETASGKTEAVFLPILSQIPEEEFRKNVKVVYIAPLKALINNQFERIEDLALDMSVRITKWHGDARQSAKNRLLERPQGILQITPESIEGFMINRAIYLKKLFNNVDYIVIDEIHSFVGNDRGYHLQSLMHRMKKYMPNSCRIIGLSATINDSEIFKSWINHNNPENVEYICALKNIKKTQVFIDYSNEEYIIEDKLVKDILKLTKNMKAIIFCNGRKVVEELTFNLNNDNRSTKFYAHHSYISKERREFIEEKVKLDDSMCIVSTSTLELGIDIGDIDIIIQINPTTTVSSLKQRVGRSGRKANKDRLLQIYTGNENNLLLSIATVELMKKSTLEKVSLSKMNYNYLFHQILSMCVESNGLSALSVVKDILRNPIFCDIIEDEIYQFINYMISKEFLEYLSSSKEFVLGKEAEKIVGKKEFYAFFSTPPSFEVVHGSEKVGMLDYSPVYSNKSTFILSGRVWAIVDIDFDTHRIYVTKAKSGKPPRFMGDGIGFSSIIKDKVFEMLSCNVEVDYLSDSANKEYNNLKMIYNEQKVGKSDRLIYMMGNDKIFALFLPNKLCYTLKLMLIKCGQTETDFDSLGNFYFPMDYKFEDLKKVINKKYSSEELFDLVKEEEYFGKFSEFLSSHMILKMFEEKYIDIDKTKEVVKSINFIGVNF